MKQHWKYILWETGVLGKLYWQLEFHFCYNAILPKDYNNYYT